MQGQVIGNTQIIMEAWRGIQPVQALVNLRPYAVYQHQADAQAVEQGKIMDVVGKILILHRFAAERNDKGFIAVGVDVRR